MNILITGGCGFIGSKLSNYLAKDHNISVLDTCWFGNHLNNKKINLIKEDIRNLDNISFDKFDILLHLANIANDPAVELDEALSWEVNVLSSKFLIEKAIKSKIKKVIYASSGSVYGLKDEEKVTEDLELVPLSAYNKTKMISERVFLSYSDKISTYIIRPATVCGISPRMRLDLSVNLLTFSALKDNKIKVFGGDQIRPNIHIDDMVRVYDFFVKNNPPNGIYNAGFENVSIMEIAKYISSKTNADLEVSISNDPRSYRLDSSKLIKLGYKPKKTFRDAVNELTLAYDEGKLIDSESAHSINWLKKIVK